MHETVCINRRVCWVVSDLSRGNPVGMILAKTPNGLDAVYWKEANFFVGSPLLLQV